MDKHTFSYEHDGSHVTWDVRDIWAAVEHAPTIQLPISIFKPLTVEVFKYYDADDRRRVKEADLNYPIIIPESSVRNGKGIIDGFHRLCKHIQLNHTMADFKIIKEMPLPREVKGKPFKIPGLEFEWREK